MITQARMVEIKHAGLTFDIDVDGKVYQPHSVSSVVLDDVRLQAAQVYLAEAKPRKLSNEQRAYWRGVSLKTDVKNLTSRGGK